MKIDPRQFAASTLQILQHDPRRYHDFGIYWYFVKALLKEHYTRDNLFLLGDYEDMAVISRMPELPAAEVIPAAIEEFKHNTAYNLGREQVEDDQGEFFRLVDPDAGGL